MRTTRMKTLAASLCAATLIGLATPHAAAQFVTSDSAAFGEDSLVTDTTSGQTWLNLNVTQGRSFNDVLAALDSDPNLSAFRLPSAPELQTLLTDAGFSVNIPWGDLSDPARLAANASFANAFVGQTVGGGELFQGYYGVFPQPLPPGVVAAWGASVFVVPGSPVAPTAPTDQIRNPYGGGTVTQDPGWATWLVSKNPVTPVPEPSTFVLTAGALGMLALVAHRKMRREPRPRQASSR